MRRLLGKAIRPSFGGGSCGVTRLTGLIGLLAVVLGPGSCALLENLPKGLQKAVAPVAPRVTFTSASLAQSPSQALLAAYYCPDVLAGSVPLGGAGVLCQGFFGRRPGPEQMVVAFDLLFRISNPNNIPIPLASVLTAATVFPAATNQRLGASCVQLCPPGAVGCTGEAAAGACQASSRDVRSLQDFAGAAVNLLIANGIAAATGQPLSFTAPQVSAASELDVVVRFSFGPQEMLAALRQLAAQSVGELRAGRRVSFQIPFTLEGTVWFDVGSFGRLAVGYGPHVGTWVLPAEGLVLR